MHWPGPRTAVGSSSRPRPGPTLGRTLNTDLWVVDLEGGAPARLTDQPGPDDQPLWRSDGRLAWLRRESPLWESAPAVIAVTKRPVRPDDTDDRDGPAGAADRLLIGDDEIDVHGRAWDNFFWRYAWSGEDFYILGTSHGCIDLVRLDGDDCEILTDTLHDFWSIQIAGDRAVLAGAGQTLPGAIFLVDLDDRDRLRAPRLLVDPNQTWRRRVGLVEPEPFSLEVGGRTVAGWFFKPAFLEPGEKIPTVLSIHGGPQWMYGGYFLPEFHILPSFGYGVIAANPTGSTGYGYDFQQGCRGGLDRTARRRGAGLRRSGRRPGLGRSGSTGGHGGQLRRTPGCGVDHAHRPLPGRGLRPHVPRDHRLLGYYRREVVRRMGVHGPALGRRGARGLLALFALRRGRSGHHAHLDQSG